MRIVALGGLEENGKNCYIIESNNEIIVVDVGSKKFENASLGIDAIVNDNRYLIENKNKIKGILISHSHLDQMGGLSYLLRELGTDVPVYGSDYTVEFLKKNYKYKNYNVLQYDKVLKLGSFKIEPFTLSHAVFGNYGYVISNGVDAVAYATDYNFNQSRKENVRTDIDKIVTLKNKYNIRALMTESLSADKSGSAAGDTNFLQSFKRYAEMTKGKLFISLYSTNVSGMLNVINLAEELNRKIVIIGRDLLTYVNISKSLGFIEHKSDMFIKTSDIKKYPADQVIVVVSGLYLEPFETLKKLSYKNHPITRIKKDDRVLIASEPDDETEGTAQKLLDFVSRTEASIKHQRINVPSHAHQEDIKMMINLFEPEHIIPIKGEFRKFKNVEEIAENLGYGEQQIHLLENGVVLNMDKNVYVETTIPVGTQLISEQSNEMIDPVLLKDRETISEEGYVLVILIYDKKTKKIIQSPEIISGGLMGFDDDEQLIESCLDIVNKEIKQQKSNADMIVRIRNKLKRYLNAKIGKSPLILTVKVEVNNK